MFVSSRKSWMALLVLLVVSSLVLSACVAPSEPEVVEVGKAVTATPEPAAGEDTLTVGVGGGSFDFLDPNRTVMTPIGKLTLQMVDPLVWQIEVGKFVPGLATEWSINEDATEYTFKLRDDVTFHDGTPFNAEAVKFTFDRIVDPETKSQLALGLMGPYEETEIVNDYEIIVRFSSPYAPFLDSISQPYTAPVSPTMVKEQGSDFGQTTFAGTGPFMLESMVIDSEYVLVRNPDYHWGPKEWGMDRPPEIEKIVFKPIGEDATKVAALLVGEIDFLDEVPTLDFRDLEANPDFTTVGSPVQGMARSLMMNHQLPPTDELAVRRAMQLAMDKEGMLETVFNGIGAPACGVVTSTTFGFCSELCDMYTYDLDAARQVLEEAGWVDADGDGIRERDGQRLVVGEYFRGDQDFRWNYAGWMKDNFARIGIEVELYGLEGSGYFDAVHSGEHHTQSWMETSTDPDMFLRGTLHSINAGGGTNRNNLVDPEIDRMIDMAASEPDVEKREQLYCDFLKEVKHGAHMEGWVELWNLYAHSNHVSGVHYYLGGTFPYFAAASLTE